ncbi:MAG: saccharopine dehydrogenase [Pseudomonadota bacterium]
MTHLWVRAEQRENEERVGITPDGVAQLITAGMRVTVEESATRILPDADYAETGCDMALENSWPDAPRDAIVFGLKELPDDGTPLPHRHIMFGHAFKGQFAGQALLKRFKAGGGTLLDIEYLVEPDGRRVAAFGYWAGYAGAAVSLKAWAAQTSGATCPPVSTWRDKDALLTELAEDMAGRRPSAIVIGALGRVGTGAADLCEVMGITPTHWDMAETQSGGPFPEILEHDLFFNCILARPSTPQFVPRSAVSAARKLSVVGDIACDPDSDYNPIPIYDAATTWADPVTRVSTDPVLDVMAIDNLPSLLPKESSLDFAAQLLPSLKALDKLNEGVWGRARATFEAHVKEV